MAGKQLIFKKTGKYFNKNSWEDAKLALYSGGLVQIKTKEKSQKIDVQLTPFVEIGEPKYGKFEGVFVIHTVSESKYDTGPRFACESPEDSDRCVQLLNYETLKLRIELIHPHPLTVATGPASIPCAICSGSKTKVVSSLLSPPKSTDSHARVCEFCAKYSQCNGCHVKLTTSVPTLVKSPTHQHQLMRLESARGMWISKAYKGRYECDTCGTTSDSVIYHCVACGDFDECPKCALKDQSLNGDVATSSAQLTLDVGHLSKAVKASDGKYSLSVRPDTLCPVNMSMKTTKCWDLSRIEHEPALHAYMEVTFDQLASDSVVGVGVANQIFEQNHLLGHQQNSFGVYSNGKASHNRKENEISFYNMTFTSGDTIGVGILFDSFNQRAVYYTKNGKYIGSYKDNVHKGMDCFPGVTFTKISKVQFSVNFAGPFKFDVKSLPNYRNNARDYISSVPNEILDVISAKAAISLAMAAQFRTVCRRMSASFASNAVWRNFALKMYPNQNKNLKLKSWFNYCKARKTKVKAYNHPIENCDFEFECPLKWESLQSTAIDSNSDKERFCDKCQKTVYNVSDQATLTQYIAMGRCVTFIEEVEHLKADYDYGGRKMGKRMAPKGFVSTAPFESSKRH